MKNVWLDIKQSCRSLRRCPGFTLLVVFTLALGIGANSTIYSIVNAILFAPLPYPDGRQLVWVVENNPRQHSADSVSPANFEDWKNQTRVFSDLAVYVLDTVTVTGGNEPERLAQICVSKEMLPLLGAKPMLGRCFLTEDYIPGQDRTIMLSYTFWERRFGSQADLVGRTLVLNGQVHTITGILAKDFKLGRVVGGEPDIVKPLPLNISEPRNRRYLHAIARLKPGVNLDQAQQELKLISQRLEKQYPETNAGWAAHVYSVQGGADPLFYVFLVTVLGAVLLIACTNVTNLLLARGASRAQEISVRSALGASTKRIMQQLLTESLLLAGLGGILGLFLAYWGCDLMKLLVEGTNASLADFRIDQRVLGFTIAVTLLTGIFVGLVPALKIAKVDPAPALKEGGRHISLGKSHLRLRNVLVVTQIAVTLALLVAAGLVLSSVFNMWHIDPGFRATQVLTLQINLPQEHYAQDQQQVTFVQQLLTRLATQSGTESASVSSVLPLGGDASASFTIEGQPKPPRGEEPQAGFRVISPRFFSTLSIPLKKGRGFNASDSASAAPVALINEKMAQKYWGQENPIGARIEVAGHPRTIIGVVGDVRMGFIPTIPPSPGIYVPFDQAPTHNLWLLIKTKTADPLALIGAVKKDIYTIDPNQPVTRIQTLTRASHANMGSFTLGSTIMALVSLGALLLATIGIYGVVAYSVSQRINEFGIRLALGAQRRDVFQLVLKQGLYLIALGVLLGTIVSLGIGRVLCSKLHGVHATDPLIFIGIPVFLLLIALCACCIPARRATRIAPMEALRYE